MKTKTRTQNCKSSGGILKETARSKRGKGPLKEQKCAKCGVLFYVNR